MAGFFGMVQYLDLVPADKMSDGACLSLHQPRVTRAGGACKLGAPHEWSNILFGAA